MSNKYFNLAGWLRDVRAVLNSGDDLAQTYHQQLIDLLEEVTDGPGDEGDLGDDVADAEDMEPEDADDDVVVQRPRIGSRARALGARPPARSLRPLGGTARVEDPVPRDVQEEGKRSRSRTAPVAGAGKRVKRGKK